MIGILTTYEQFRKERDGGRRQTSCDRADHFGIDYSDFTRPLPLRLNGTVSARFDVGLIRAIRVHRYTCSCVLVKEPKVRRLRSVASVVSHARSAGGRRPTYSRLSVRGRFIRISTFALRAIGKASTSTAILASNTLHEGSLLMQPYSGCIDVAKLADALRHIALATATARRQCLHTTRTRARGSRNMECLSIAIAEGDIE